MFVVPEWIERHCIVPDGFRKGRPFRLYEYQLAFIGAFYTVRGDARWVPENPILAPAFVYRRGLLVGPQKVGKNPLIAAQVCVEGVGPALFAGWAGTDEGYVCAEHGCRCGWEYPYDPGEPMGMSWPTPLIQITAFSEDSTENTYDALRPMIDDGPLHDLIPKTGEEFIRLPNGGRIDTVTSSNQSRLGQRVTYVPQDELGLWTALNKMVKLADTQYRGLAGMGGRAALTSNAWDPTENSVAQREYESSATDIYRYFAEAPKNLSFANKAERRKIYRIVYPSDTLKENGGHLDLDSIEAEAADMAERDLPQASRFFGNGRMAGAGLAVDPDHWDDLAKPQDVPAGTLIGAGFDGSISGDATVLRGCTAAGYRFTIGSWEKPVDQELRRWFASHPGAAEWRVDRQEVRQKIRQMRATWRVGRMLCDTPKWETEVEDWADEFGPDANGDPIVVKFDTNQARRFSPAVDRWLTAIDDDLPHDGDELVGRHVKAAHKKKVRLADDDDDRRTRYVLVKGTDKHRIDGAVTDVLALEAAMTMVDIPPEFRSNYEDERLTVAGARGAT